MPMTTAANQVAIGEYLYFFRSPVPGTRSCVIFGHAGWVPKLGEQFQLPQGASLHFKAWHGQPNLTTPKLTVLAGEPQRSRKDLEMDQATPKSARMLIDEREKRFFGPGEWCFDYVIVKGLGRHWDAQNPSPASYTEVKSAMDLAAGVGHCDHFVSVRNRRFRGAQRYVMLSSVIEQVQAHDGAIDSFIMAGCRGVHPHWTP